MREHIRELTNFLGLISELWGRGKTSLTKLTEPQEHKSSDWKFLLKHCWLIYKFFKNTDT